MRLARAARVCVCAWGGWGEGEMCAAKTTETEVGWEGGSNSPPCSAPMAPTPTAMMTIGGMDSYGILSRRGAGETAPQPSSSTA